MTIILKDRIYINKGFDVNKAEKHYTRFMINTRMCKGCDFIPDRPCSMCEVCERGAVDEIIKTYKTKMIKGKRYHGFPMGDRERLEELIDCDFDEHKIKDRRAKHPFNYDIKFTGTLRDYQVPAFESWVEAGYGLFEAPPRSGKTITAIAIAIAMGQKTIILASQEDYLRGFIKACAQYTNLPELEEIHGKKLFGVITKDSDFDKYQICVCTYQKFIRDYSKIQKHINKNFGLVWVDEVHKAAATCFSSVMMRVATRYRGGCSATMARKDKRQFLTYQALGNVTARCIIESMKPTLYIHPTEVRPPKKQYGNTPGAWTYAMKFLLCQKVRQAQMFELIKHDIKQGRSIVIPLIHVKHIFDTVKMINNFYEEDIAAAFTGQQTKDQREIILEKACSYEYKVIVGTRPLLQLGLNVPRWDALYYIVPMNNKPNWEQESARILTPPSDESPDKKDPIIRMFVDEGMKQSENCFVNTVNYSMGFDYKFPLSTKRLLGHLKIVHATTSLALNKFESAEMQDEFNTEFDRKDTCRRRINPMSPEKAGIADPETRDPSRHC